MRRAAQHLRPKSTTNGGTPAAGRAALLSRLAPRPGMTLIELLVAIVILVTVLGVVIPVLSPNNDARRIRSAAQQLQSMLAQAQALAAREGRPYGVAFRETQVEVDNSAKPPARLTGGVALEAFFISEPKPFAGFSEYSRVRRVQTNPNAPVQLQFVLADAPTGRDFPLDYAPDPVPPYTIRRGDRIEIDGIIYRITDRDRDGDGNDDTQANPPFREGDFYEAVEKAVFECVPISPLSTPPLPPSRSMKPYKFLRQASNPATRPGNTAGPPLQFPRGVGVDFFASGVDFPDPRPMTSTEVERFLQFSFTSLQSRQLATLAELDLNDPADRPWPKFTPPLTAGVMFAPSGRVHSVWVNGENLEEDFWVRPDRVFLLVGRIENGTRTLDEIGDLADFSDVDPLPASANADDPGAEEVALRREQLNWLNRDSQWITIAGKTGRIVTSPNDTSVDPRLHIRSNQTVNEQVALQIQAARTFARELATGGAQ